MTMDSTPKTQDEQGKKVVYSRDEVESLEVTKDEYIIILADGSNSGSEGTENQEPDFTPTSYPKPIATDSLCIELDEAKFQKDEETGILVIPDCVIAKEIVQDYDGVSVYKPREEIEKAVEFLDQRPITDEHPPDGLVTSRDQIKGVLMNPRFVGDGAVVDLEIRSPKLVEDIETGENAKYRSGFSVTCRTSPEPLRTQRMKEYSVIF